MSSTIVAFNAISDDLALQADDRVLSFDRDRAPLGMTLAAHLSFEERSSDIWGYVGPDKREYAIIALHEGTAIIEIDQDQNLLQRAYIPGGASRWRDVQTLGHHLYIVAEENADGMQIVDLSDLPSRARLVSTFRGFDHAHSMFIDVDRALAFVAGTNLGNKGLRIYSLSDPVSPVELGVWDPYYVHDVHARGNQAYTFNAELGLAILDVTNPSQPTPQQSLEYDDMAYTHSGWASKSGELLAVTDELDEALGGNTRILFFSKTLPDGAYAFSSAYTGPSKAIDKNVFLLGDFAVFSNFTGGVSVLDLGGTTGGPRLHARYDTYPGHNEPLFAGAWGVYPYLPSGRLIVSDINRGLFVMQMDADADGVPDFYEARTRIFVSATDTGTDPTKADSDGDGLSDGDEIALGTDPNRRDTDGDGFPDGAEVESGDNPILANPMFPVPLMGTVAMAVLAALLAGHAVRRILRAHPFHWR
jgi:choice-of-anchor B domain-containing protein